VRCIMRLAIRSQLAVGASSALIQSVEIGVKTHVGRLGMGNVAARRKVPFDRLRTPVERTSRCALNRSACH
jgi:hypothetical protein